MGRRFLLPNCSAEDRTLCAFLSLVHLKIRDLHLITFLITSFLLQFYIFVDSSILREHNSPNCASLWEVEYVSSATTSWPASSY